MLSIISLAAMAALSGAPQEYAPNRGQDGPQRVAPRGSYAATCSGSYVNQGRLYADCRDERGRLRGTSIDLQRCGNFDVANDNGRLVCGNVRGDFENGGGNNGGGWGDNNGGGNWGGNGGRNTITVYRDANYRGASLTLRGAVPDLRSSGLNDRISSMRFQGEWEACTDANFRGRCQTFSNDVGNLDRFGMNDSISSLRPVRGGRW